MESVEVTILFRGVGKGPPESRVRNFMLLHKQKQTMTLRLSRQLPGRHPFNRNSRNRSPCNFPRGFNTNMLHSSCTFERIDEHHRHLSKDTLMPRKLLLPVLIACGSDRGPKNLCQGCSYIRSRPV